MTFFLYPSLQITASLPSVQTNRF